MNSQRRDWQTPRFRKTRHYRGGLRGIVNRDVAALLLPSVEVDQPAWFFELACHCKASDSMISTAGHLQSDATESPLLSMHISHSRPISMLRTSHKDCSPVRHFN